MTPQTAKTTAASLVEANLFDIDAKYADVVPLAEALDYLASFTGSVDFAAKAQDDFDRWWPRTQRFG